MLFQSEEKKITTLQLYNFTKPTFPQNSLQKWHMDKYRPLNFGAEIAMKQLGTFS